MQCPSITDFRAVLNNILSQKRVSGPSPLYKTPLKYIWPCFILMDIIMLYILVTAFFFLTIFHNECVEMFPAITHSFVNVVIIFIIDFITVIIRKKDVVDEDEIKINTIYTIVACVLKISVNGFSFYVCLKSVTTLLDSTDEEIIRRCQTSLGKFFLIVFMIVDSLPFVGTYCAASTTLLTIIDFNKQIQKYDVIV